ncbi:hypothetical protein MKW94_001149 [Papaver nudicaule]|uniref:Large ribosomal subunit protein uL2 C-terminal domain-containing protein n=1 Tax=Papaver nudicaule TaxID=74823 RepID=A0AA41RZ53_PAPNU|nr:hypothetical protein [Papaver nudicaule]
MVGNVLLLRSIPEGAVVCNVKHHVGVRSTLARASGDNAIVMGHNPDNGTSRIKLPSGANTIVPRLRSLCWKAGNAYHKYRVKRSSWPKFSGVAVNPVEYPHGGGNQQHIGHASTVRNDAPPSQKVCLIAARKTGTSPWTECCSCFSRLVYKYSLGHF